MNIFSLVLCVLVLLGGCQAQKPQVRLGAVNQATGEGASEAIAQQLQITQETIVHDAYDHTFGTLQVRLYAKNGTGLFRGKLQTQRFAYYSSTVAPTSQQSQALEELCQGIALSRSPTQLDEITDWSPSEKIYLHWRSYYSAAVKESIAPLLVQSDQPLLCLLRIRVAQQNGTLEHHIAFDPIPEAGAQLSGTAHQDLAVQEVVMLLDEEALGEGFKYQEKHLFEVKSEAEILPDVPSIKRGEIKVAKSEALGPGCRIHMQDGGTKVGNPKDLQQLSFSIESPQRFILQKSSPQTVGGALNPLCAAQKLALADKAVGTGISCETYLQIQQEMGMEAACQWKIELANERDPVNALALDVAMTRIEFETVDIRTPAGASRAIPEAGKNPVALKALEFVNFSEAQKGVLEQAFDFWIATSPLNYALTFEKHVTRVTYLGRNEGCQQANALAYVTSLTSTEIFWCEGAGMGTEDIATGRSPTRILLVAVTMSHETAHTRGMQHDIDARNYLPCAGTAMSAVLGFDTTVTCKSDYCVGLKDLARFEYIAELDYSLRADPRRFQGQCQLWNTGMGLTRASFRT